MDRTKVRSSNIASIGYDEASCVLEVEFHNRAVYQFQKVPKRAYCDLMRSRSVGSSFHTSIRPFFKSERLPDAEAQAGKADVKPERDEKLPKGHVRAHRVVRTSCTRS